MSNYPSGMSISDLVYVGELSDPIADLIENNYDDWKKEKILENWEDVCSNLSIEIENTEQLYNDEILQALIVAEHDRQFPGCWDENEFLDEMEG